MNKLLTSKNNGKLLESALLIILGVAVAFTFVFAFTSVDLVANAEEENVIGGEPGFNSVPVASGAVLLFEDYEQELDAFWSYGDVFHFLDLSFLDLSSGIYQVVCKAYLLDGTGYYLTNLLYVDFDFYLQTAVLADYGAGDLFFDVCLDLSDKTLGPSDFLNSFKSYEDSYVTFYALYKIEGQPSSSGVNVEQITDIMIDGVSFSANAIASSISYTFDNLFLNEDGSLTVYTQLVIWFAGISLLLSFVRLLTDWLFSLGGNKDKL